MASRIGMGKRRSGERNSCHFCYLFKSRECLFLWLSCSPLFFCPIVSTFFVGFLTHIKLTRRNSVMPRFVSLFLRVSRRSFSDSISYSGGQATVGQGGFYGSGGNRKLDSQTAHKPEAIAHLEDVDTLRSVMNDVSDVMREISELADKDVERMIALKSKRRKMIHNKEVSEIISRLHFGGEPVWGLSVNERELVTAARRAVEES